MSWALQTFAIPQKLFFSPALLMHLRHATTVPSGQRLLAATAAVLHVFQAAEHVWNAGADQGREEESDGPGAGKKGTMSAKANFNCSVTLRNVDGE